MLTDEVMQVLSDVDHLVMVVKVQFLDWLRVVVGEVLE